MCRTFYRSRPFRYRTCRPAGNSCTPYRITTSIRASQDTPESKRSQEIGI